MSVTGDWWRLHWQRLSMHLVRLASPSRCRALAASNLPSGLRGAHRCRDSCTVGSECSGGCRRNSSRGAAKCADYAITSRRLCNLFSPVALIRTWPRPSVRAERRGCAVAAKVRSFRPLRSAFTFVVTLSTLHRSQGVPTRKTAASLHAQPCRRPHERSRAGIARAAIDAAICGGATCFATTAPTSTASAARRRCSWSTDLACWSAGVPSARGSAAAATTRARSTATDSSTATRR